jgi:hypothetical protein
MAHFAEIGSNGDVLRVLVVADEQEHRGQEFLADDLNLGGTWIQTSYNSNVRKNFAIDGYVYDSERDAFYEKKPFPSWILNEDTCKWHAPVAAPDTEDLYRWNEDSTSWDKIDN